MQRVTFLIVGRIKTPWISQGFDVYTSRLSYELMLDVVTIPPSKNIDPKKMSEEESERIVEKIAKFDGDVWLLDEKGKEMTSSEFSKVISTAKDAGRSLLFILGGPYRLTEEVKAKIPQKLRLSAMTFPHEFCSLVFLEQLYRACEIQKGSGYHH